MHAMSGLDTDEEDILDLHFTLNRKSPMTSDIWSDARHLVVAQRHLICQMTGVHEWRSPTESSKHEVKWGPNRLQAAGFCS